MKKNFTIFLIFQIHLCVCRISLPHHQAELTTVNKTISILKQNITVFLSYEQKLDKFVMLQNLFSSTVSTPALFDSPMRFSTSSFFHNSNLPVPVTNGLKKLRFWLRIR